MQSINGKTPTLLPKSDFNTNGCPVARDKDFFFCGASGTLEPGVDKSYCIILGITNIRSLDYSFLSVSKPDRRPIFENWAQMKLIIN